MSLRQIGAKEELSAAGVLKILRRSKDNDNKSLILAPVELTLDVDIEREIAQQAKTLDLLKIVVARMHT